MRKKPFLFVFLLLVLSFCSFGFPFAHAAVTDIFTSGFEESPWNSKWDQTAGTWVQGTSSTPGTPWAPHAGSNMAYCHATSDGSIYTDDVNTSGAIAVGVSFWYMDDDLDGGTDFEFYVYDGSAYDLIVQLNPANEDQWYYYSWSSTDSQYFKSNFKLSFAATPEANENAFLDDVTINETTSVAYTADLSTSLSTSRNLAPSWNAHLGLTESLSFSSGVGLSFASVVGLGVSAATSLSVLAQTIFHSDLTQMASVAASMVPAWLLKADLQQSLTSTWSILGTWQANTALTLSATFNWLLDIIHFTSGTAYTADLSLSISTSWLIDLLKGTQQTVGLTLEVISLWTVDLLSGIVPPMTEDEMLALIILSSIVFAVLGGILGVFLFKKGRR